MLTMDQWEQWLKPYFNPSLRIIGEIPLTQSDIDDMGVGIRACIQRNRLPEATRILTERYPYLFLAFLVGFASHNTEQSYWIALSIYLGVDHNHLYNHQWHASFLQMVEELGLPYFEDAANQYVTTIRFHGGIPAYSLPDFFERLLLPTIKRPSLSEVSSKQAMKAVLKTAHFVDMPVINFLENSGKLGEDFFDASRKLARHYLKTQGELLSADELGLPVYLVEAFETYMERGADEQGGQRLRKPVLGVNPFAELDRIWLMLPEQEVPMRYAAGALEWQVSGIGLQNEVTTCMMHRRRQDTLLDQDFLPIPATPPSIKVSLVYREQDQEECLRRWSLPLLPAPASAQLLAFNVDGKQIRVESSLPAEVLILMYPADGDIHVEGVGAKTEEYGRMEGAWRDWQIHAWDLRNAAAIQLCRLGTPIQPVIPIAGRQLEPELVEGSLSPYGSDEIPLYIGQPPAIKIPLRFGFEPEEELHRWSAEVSSVWNTDPAIQTTISLDQYKEEIRIAGSAAFFSLQNLLGESPVGTYHIKLYGPSGTTKAFRVRLWPKLTPIGLPKYVLPANQNNRPFSFMLRLPDNTKCEAQAGASQVEVEEKGYGWDVTVSPEGTEASLNLVWQAGSSPVRVPVSIPIPRLRWALTLDHESEKLNWSSSPLQKSALSLLESKTAALHIRAAGIHEHLSRVSLELVEVDHAEQTLQEEKFKSTVFSPDWLRVSLQSFRGTLQNDCQQGRFEFVLYDYEANTAHRIPLLSAPRDISIKNVRLVQVSELKWIITWDEEQPLKNRRILLMPAWQLWQEPWEIKLPDEARGEYILENVALPKIRYLIYFYIAPAWEPAQSKPPEDTPAHIIDLIDPLDRLVCD